MKQFILLIGLIFFTVSFPGCSTLNNLTGTTTDVCADLENGDSVICDLCGLIDKKPEDIASVLKLTNFGVLAVGEPYDAEQALAFIEEIEADVTTAKESGVTYAAFVAAVGVKYDALPTAVQALFKVVSIETLFGSTDTSALSSLKLTDNDFDMLLLHLEKQKAIAEAFIEAGD